MWLILAFITGIVVGVIYDHSSDLKTLYDAVSMTSDKNPVVESAKILFEVAALRIEQFFRRSVVSAGNGYYSLNFFVCGHLHRLYIKPLKGPRTRTMSPVSRGYSSLIAREGLDALSASVSPNEAE